MLPPGPWSQPLVLQMLPVRLVPPGDRADRVQPLCLVEGARLSQGLRVNIFSSLSPICSILLSLERMQITDSNPGKGGHLPVHSGAEKEAGKGGPRVALESFVGSTYALINTSPLAS